MAAPVLLVHDDIAVIATVRRLLAREGHEVILATSAADAIIAFGHYLPGLIILAPEVEGGRGRVVLEELAQHPDRQLSRVLLLGESIPGFSVPIVPLPLDGQAFLEAVSLALRSPSDADAWAVVDHRRKTLEVPALQPDAPEEWRATMPTSAPETSPELDWFADAQLDDADWSIAAMTDEERREHGVSLERARQAEAAAAAAFEQAHREVEEEAIATIEQTIPPIPPVAPVSEWTIPQSRADLESQLDEFEREVLEAARERRRQREIRKATEEEIRRELGELEPEVELPSPVVAAPAEEVPGAPEPEVGASLDPERAGAPDSNPLPEPLPEGDLAGEAAWGEASGQVSEPDTSAEAEWGAEPDPVAESAAEVQSEWASAPGQDAESAGTEPEWAVSDRSVEDPDGGAEPDWATDQGPVAGVDGPQAPEWSRAPDAEEEADVPAEPGWSAAENDADADMRGEADPDTGPGADPDRLTASAVSTEFGQPTEDPEWLPTPGLADEPDLPADPASVAAPSPDPEPSADWDVSIAFGGDAAAEADVDARDEAEALNPTESERTGAEVEAAADEVVRAEAEASGLADEERARLEAEAATRAEEAQRLAEQIRVEQEARERLEAELEAQRAAQENLRREAEMLRARLEAEAEARRAAEERLARTERDLAEAIAREQALIERDRRASAAALEAQQRAAEIKEETERRANELRAESAAAIEALRADLEKTAELARLEREEREALAARLAELQRESDEAQARADEAVRLAEAERAQLEAEQAARAEAEAAAKRAREEAEAIVSFVRRPIDIPAARPLTIAPAGMVSVEELARLVAQLDEARAEVRLDLRVEDALRTLWFQRGAIVAALSTLPHESVLDRARRDGLINTHQAAELRLLRGVSPGEVLQRLRARGHLRDEEVVPLVQRYTETVALEALSEPTSEYRLSDDPPPPGVPLAAIPREGLAVAFEALRRAVDGEERLGALGGLGATPRFVAEPDLRTLQLTDRERRLLSHIDGETTIEELLVGAGLRQENVLRLLVAANVLGWMELIPAALEPVAPAAELELERLDAKYRQIHEADYFSILGLTRSAGGEEVQRAYLQLTAEFDPIKFVGHPDVTLQHRARQVVEALTEAAQVLGDDRLRANYARHLVD